MLKEITIVGGGSAAWMTAAFFQNNLKQYKLTVIDKETPSPIGVGEGTLLNFIDFMFQCGLEFKDWFPDVDATLKSGILFPDWREEGTKVWHPFPNINDYRVDEEGNSRFDVWGARSVGSIPIEFRSFCLPEYEAQVLHNKIYTGQKTNITVNINALKLASRLKKYVKDHVTYIESDVVSVNRNEYGDVTSLLLKNGVEHSSDFFIDCTGFKSILKKPRRMDLIKSGRLFVNTAVAGTVSYENESVEMTPFAICPAVDQGWVWNIPTQGRIGSGLVFNRDITSVEDAKVKFSNYWNGRVNPDDLKVIDWTPYYENNIWDRNVCSIGLSAGFMEPLESTGIGGTIESIKALAASLQERFYDHRTIYEYNTNMHLFFEDVIDFIAMHYSEPKHDSTFWNWVRESYTKTDRQLFYEDFMKDPDKGIDTTMFRQDYVYKAKVWSPLQWILWLAQIGYPLERKGFSPEYVDARIHEVQAHERKLFNESKPHQDFIESLNKGQFL